MGGLLISEEKQNREKKWSERGKVGGGAGGRGRRGNFGWNVILNSK